MPEVPPTRAGLLGADIAVENGRYRIARIYDGESWNPELRAPLAAPGVEVAVGDYLLAVNGVELAAHRQPAPPARRHRRSADGAHRERQPRWPAPGRSRSCRSANDQGLRTRAWVEDNRRLVDKLSGGQLAYVYVPNTGQPRLRELQPLLLRAAGQAGRGHRRALQRRRLGRRLHHRRARPRLRRLLQQRRRRRACRSPALGRHLGPEGDDHQRDGRLGRRPDAVHVPAPQDRPAGRHAHLGRPGRAPPTRRRSSTAAP